MILKIYLDHGIFKIVSVIFIIFSAYAANADVASGTPLKRSSSVPLLIGKTKDTLTATANTSAKPTDIVAGEPPAIVSAVKPATAADATVKPANTAGNQTQPPASNIDSNAKVAEISANSTTTPVTNSAAVKPVTAAGEKNTAGEWPTTDGSVDDVTKKDPLVDKRGFPLYYNTNDIKTNAEKSEVAAETHLFRLKIQPTSIIEEVEEVKKGAEKIIKLLEKHIEAFLEEYKDDPFIEEKKFLLERSLKRMKNKTDAMNKALDMLLL